MSYGDEDTGWQDAWVTETDAAEAQSELNNIYGICSDIATIALVYVTALNSQMKHTSIKLNSDFVEQITGEFEAEFNDAIADLKDIIERYEGQEAE